MELSKEQTALMKCLTILGIENEAMIGIALSLQKPTQLDEMLTYIGNNQSATQEEILLKTAEIAR